MRLTMWFALAALLAGGCASSCPGGGCAPGQSLFNLPMARYGEREIPTPCADGSCSTGSCSTGACRPMPYLTFSKYVPCLDGWATRQTAKSCANRMLWRQFFQCYRVPSKHYRDGFRQAFIDVAEGEDGQLPAVPPPKYWNAHYRTEAGARKVESWFGGYRAGSAMALIELAPLRRISASYDWSIEKPRDQFAKGNCLPGMCLTDQSGASMMAGLQSPMPGYPGYQPGVGGFAPPTGYAPPYDPAGSAGPGYEPPPGYDPNTGYGAAPGYGYGSGYDPGYDPNGGFTPGYSSQPYGGVIPDGQASGGSPQGYGPAEGYGPGPGYAPQQSYAPGPDYGPQPNYAPQPNYGQAPDYGQGSYGAGPPAQGSGMQPQYGTAPGYGPGPGYGPPAGYGPAPGNGPANGYGPATGSPPNAAQPGQVHQVNPGETTGRSHFYNPASPGGLSQRRENLQTPYWAKPGAGDPAESPPPGVPNDGPVWRMAPTQN